MSQLFPKSRWYSRLLAPLLFLPALAGLRALAQTESPIPLEDIRVHCFCPDGNYAGWTIKAFCNTTERNNLPGGPVQVNGLDGFGACFDGGLTADATNVGSIIRRGETKDPGPNQFVEPSTQSREFREISGSAVLSPTIGQDPPLAPNHARIHYYRRDEIYNNWVLCVYGTTTDPVGGFCGTSEYFAGYDNFGSYFDAPVLPGHLSFTIHNCSAGTKDPGPAHSLQIPQQLEGWVIFGAPTAYLQLPKAAQLLAGPFKQSQEFWIDGTTTVMPASDAVSGWICALNAGLTATLRSTSTGLSGGTSCPLTPYSGTLTLEELTRFPQLSSYALLKLPADANPAMLRLALNSQLEISAVAPDGILEYATGLQTFGALDGLLAYNGRLGVFSQHPNDTSSSDWEDDNAYPIKVRVWAPTAQYVSVLAFDQPTDRAPNFIVTMHEPKGVWVADGGSPWQGEGGGDSTKPQLSEYGFGPDTEIDRDETRRSRTQLWRRAPCYRRLQRKYQPSELHQCALAGLKWHLDPILRESADPIVRTATLDKRQGTAMIPALTTAVFTGDVE